jgi:hypothetical protein
MTNLPTAQLGVDTSASGESLAIPEQPSDLLIEFVLSLIVPLLMTGCIVDIALARLAALETIAAYKARGQGELVTIAQIVGFALAALDNLRLSTAADLSLTMKLRLRGNANALNRASQRASIALQRPSLGADAPAGPPSIVELAPDGADPLVAEAAVLASLDATRAALRQAEECLLSDRAVGDKAPSVPAPRDQATAPDAERRRKLMWASAMTDVAAEFSATLGQLSPMLRSAEMARIGVLNETARALSAGSVRPDRSAEFRSQLLGSTSLGGKAGFVPG